MKNIRSFTALKKCIAVLLVVCCALTGYTQQLREEFNGPFDSWANVQTRFRAKGDGRKDDTRALQMALDSLSVAPLKFNAGKTAYSVIYLPKGRYRITQTLLLKGKIGINIIGEDPENTIIEWDGRKNDTMFWADGSAYYKISRITFTTTKGQSDVEGIGIHWKNKWNTKTTKSYASLNIEVSDCIFKQLTVGIGGGYKWNDSEIKIDRCFFYNCTRAGIEIMGANALDYWIWHCRFFNCGVGVYNGNGNYHIYNSYFTGSKVADVQNSNGYYTSIRGCFSEKSTAFSLDKGSSTNPFKRIFQDNIVKQPGSLPIFYHHIGKPTFFNNQFDKITTKDNTDDKTEKAVISYSSWMGTYFTILSIGNSYYYKEPFLVKKKNRKDYVLNDTYGKTVESSGNAFLKELPGFLRYVKRKVFDVPADATTADIQAIINKAAQLKGQRPIVHFGYGTYTLDKTLFIPAGSDFQIIGDGLRYATVIRADTKGQFTRATLIKVAGPSSIQMRDIQFGTTGSKILHAIEFDNVDQQRSAVNIDQLNSNCDTTFFVDRLNYTRFEKNNSFFADGNVIIGGDIQKAGKGTLNVLCFGGQYSQLEVQNNARFISKDCWWEGPERVPLNLKGDGEITIDGTLMGPRKADTLPTIKVGKFSGKISLMNMYVHGGIELTANNPQLQFYLWNTNFYRKKMVMETIPKNFRGQLAYSGLTAQCLDKKDPDCKYTRSFEDRFVNIKDINGFINEMTLQDRQSVPQPYVDLPNDITNIYLTRVTLDNFRKGLSFNR